MAVPAFPAFMRPVLLVLEDGQVRPRKEVRQAAVAAMDLSDEDLAERIKSGDTTADSRAHWAIEFLAQSGAIERPNRGLMRITPIGRRLLADHPDEIRESDLADLPGYQDWAERSKQKARDRRVGTGPSAEGPAIRTESETPLERLIEAIDLLDRNTARQLVERLQNQPPIFLERAVLKLLHAMGYGGSEEDGEHLGRSHDEGIDGVIRQDALGLERVYVQAKRYAKGNTVGSPLIREFVGALAGVGASGGVFITTSQFSSDAIKFAERLPTRVILIDGDQLGKLMIEYGVGVVVTETLRVSEVDENFFDDEA